MHQIKWYTFVAVLLAVAGIVSVPATVYVFRKVYKPLMRRYRSAKALSDKSSKGPAKIVPLERDE